MLHGRRQGIDPREIDPEGRAVADLAIDRDVAAALFHDAVAGRETKPRALALLLGGEKWLEQSRLHLGRHPAAVIGDREQHVTPGT